MRKFLLGLLLIVLIVALVYKSPFSALYNYNKAKALYDQKQYEQSLPYFERSLFADSKGILSRFYYVLALSKAKPKFSIQKKLFEISNSNIDDEASKVAKTQVRAVRRSLLSGLEPNYIYNATYGNDILRWDIRSFPLKVYIDKLGSVPSYYIDAIEQAMALWVRNTNFVKFERIQDEKSADIIVTFKDIDKNQCENGVCKYVVAYTEPSISGNNLLKRMNLTFYRTNPLNQGFSREVIYNTAIHEFGHTLGIMGHSDNPMDLMYSLKNDDFSPWYGAFRQGLSMRDLNTLVLLYRLEPTISNVENLASESFYYSPLILGNNDVILQKKLIELKKYIDSYPEIAAGYINISAVYADMGDIEASLSALSKAEKYAKTQDEQYLVAYNRAITYYNLQKFDTALEYANLAKSIKDTQGVQELIHEIEQLTLR